MKPCYVYFVRGGDKKHSPLKIGVTYDIKKRIKEMQTGSPKILRFQCAVIFDSKKIAHKVEKIIHKTLAGRNIHGEWFTCGVKTTGILKMLEPYIIDHIGSGKGNPVIYKI